jgi:hypothetical protein
LSGADDDRVESLSHHDSPCLVPQSHKVL